MSRKSKSAVGGCLPIIILILFNVFVGGYATEYLVETWVTYIKEVPLDIPFYVACIAGLFFAEATVPLAIVTWILTFVIAGL